MDSSQGRRKIVAGGGEEPAKSSAASKNEVLIIMSKLKNYVRQHSGLNTSAGVAEALSNVVRQQCDRAIAKAKEAGRKTLMDRDFL